MLSTLFFSTAPRSLPHIHTIISHQPTCIYKKLTPVFHCSKYSHRSPYAPSTVKLSLHTNIVMTRQALNKQLVSHQVLKCNPTDIHPSETTGYSYLHLDTAHLYCSTNTVQCITRPLMPKMYLPCQKLRTFTP